MVNYGLDYIIENSDLIRHTQDMRLSNIKNSRGVFSIFDFSRIAALAQATGLEFDNKEHQQHLSYLISSMMHYLSPEMSGVVVDPELGFDSITKKANGTGLLLSLEKKAATTDPTFLPTIATNWGVEYISNNYGVAKLELYYHPQEQEALRKKQFVAEIYDYCQYEGIDLLLELLVYHPITEKPTQEVLLEAQLQATREFSNSCSLFALEYLGNAFSAVTLTAQLDTPWIYTAREVTYEEFKQNLRICMESGAKGFMASDPFWSGTQTAQILSRLSHGPEQDEYIKTQIRDKVIEAVRIAQEQAAV